MRGQINDAYATAKSLNPKKHHLTQQDIVTVSFSPVGFMGIAGYPQYEQALQEAIAEAGILDTGIVGEAQPGLALVRFDYPDSDFSDNNSLYFSFNDLSGNDYRNTWPRQIQERLRRAFFI